MRKWSVDTVLRLKVLHRPGQLGKLVTAVAEQGALFGDISTHRMLEHYTIRDVTVETADEAQLQKVLEAVRAVDGVELISVTDRVMETHKGGKIASRSRVPINNVNDLRYVYTPGVARVARAIQRDQQLAWELTGLGNSVGIFTNGTRVLGLGNVGPLASLPVMEGKAVLYDRFAGISATPILLNTLEPERFVEAVVCVAQSFGGIHLEDIRIPDCFYIEDELKKRLRKPVMHDDQHGTATVALAALMKACELTGMDIKNAHVGQLGLGAAGSAIARLAMAHGARRVYVSDLNRDAVAALERDGAHGVDLPTLMQECDIVIAATGRPGLITPGMVRRGQVIFALSNPDPEIDPQVAREAGAAFSSDGRTVNNALGFPSLFKGALSVRSRSITREMMLAAAEALASLAEPGALLPDPLNPDVHAKVAHAVAEKAREQGLAGTAEL
ncbi:MAG: malic enzyme-like NAD(P)-binding protein [Myxococcota bacterium]